MKKHLQFLIPVMLVTMYQASMAQQPYINKNIDINNINAMITPSSDLFWDFNNAHFEVPKGSGLHAIFAGGLWIGGLDATGNIHLAGQTYRQTGNDFWPGPIDTIGTPGPANYLDYLETRKVNKSEIINHQLNFSTPNYVVPYNIATWPGYDTTVQRVLAPFADYNGNGIYDPENGDYPFILGDQSVYAVFNDWYNHTETGCSALGVEVHREFWGFDAPSNTALNNSIFSRYQIKNYSANDYHDFYILMWTDFDLGNAVDDYIGTDIGLDMVYVYNGDSLDETASGYGANPPAVGVYFLDQTLSGSMVYENVNNNPIGNPNGCFDFYNYAKTIWLDNQPVTYGADGRDITNPVTTYMYPGVTDPINYPLLGEWSEANAGNFPNDRRATAAIGPFNLNSQDVFTFDVGYTYARATSGGPLASVAELQNAVSGLRTMYSNGQLTATPKIPNVSAGQINVFPNPASEVVTIKNTSPDKLFNVVILDAVGRVVFKKDQVSNNMLNIDVRSFARGIYIVSVTQDKQMFNQKLIIQK